MSSTSQRIWWLGAIYAVCFVVVGVHLGGVMLGGHQDWLVRSYRNRWAFRDVPSVRGAMLDRHGRVLASDEPTFELECVYERFRLLHPVGAAIHGATQVARLGGNEIRYGYVGDEVGPEAAARELLALPVGALLRGDLPKEERRDLVQAVVTVLAATSDRSRGRVQKELRACANTAPMRPLAAALPDFGADQILAQFHGVLSRLRALDRALAELDTARAATNPADDAADGLDDEVSPTSPPPIGLLQRLDRFRVDCLDNRRTQPTASDGTVHEGELLERLARPVARRLPFALAAALRVAADDQPGLRLEPALVRRRADDLPPTLAQILGTVRALDQTGDVQRYLDARVEQALGSELDDFVPDELGPSADYRQELLQRAQRNYERVLRTRERRGTGGIESMLDDALAGSPGMRLVERDARSREQLLWSSLRVAPGHDVVLSVDLDLQRLLDDQVAAAARQWQLESPAPARIDVAMAIVDAHSGDVLALAGAPHELDGRPRLPAVLAWRGTGALGSTVKPFMLAEQLRAERLGRAHGDVTQFDRCERVWRGPDQRLYRCDSVHGEAGKDPVEALAQSCNVFFYQVALGLEESGLRRALWQFGLLPPDDGEDDGRYRERPAELPRSLCAAPRWIGRQAQPMRGIGYGLEANPVAVAGAYAALAAGRLPTLGLRRGEPRPTYALDLLPAELELVRDGLRACVEHGTAKKIDGLREFAVLGKTGTAEIVHGVANNAWFAGYLPVIAQDDVQLAFCAVVYAVPEGVHGAEAAGTLAGEVLRAIAADAALAQRYLQPGSGR